jgi:zinc protease
MLLIEGKPLETVSIEEAEAAIWVELEKICNEVVPEDELTKVKNKTESTMVFSEMALLDKAMNLAFFELLGDADLFNHETAKYLAVTAAQIQRESKAIFRKDNSSTLIYLAEK